jgi:hypothetical protein
MHDEWTCGACCWSSRRWARTRKSDPRPKSFRVLPSARGGGGGGDQRYYTGIIKTHTGLGSSSSVPRAPVVKPGRITQA